MLTPQLFINYKLKSVAHLPGRVFMYKALNTFIDDLFAFIIKMPTMHRLACLRDGAFVRDDDGDDVMVACREDIGDSTDDDVRRGIDHLLTRPRHRILRVLISKVDLSHR